MMGHVRKAIMKLTSVIIVIAVTFITVSCSSQKNGTAYSVYFLNEDGTSLTEGRVYIESQDAVSVANELLEKMNVAKGRHTSIIKPVSVSQPTVEINGIYAGVYYDSSYYGMKPSTEVLYRAAVVKELSQISDILYVRFYVDGKDAVYEDGTIIGNMSDEDFVDVIGTSKGKGFQGVVKRHGFGGVGQSTHGQHNRARKPGSIGACSYPAKVFKGMRMGGQLGGDRVTVQNLKVLKVIEEHNLLLIKGSVPGCKGSIVIIEK